MQIKAISVILENRPGKLVEISDLFGKNGINIRALSVMDRGERSLFKFIADDHKKGLQILSARNYEVKQDVVIAAEIPDHAGALNALLKPLREASVNILYLYPFIGRFDKNAIIILEVDKIDQAVEILKANWVHLLDEEIYSL